MIYIGICDDEREQQKLLADMIGRSLFAYDDVEFSYYSSGDEVVDAIEKGEMQCGLLLLDIRMPGRDGLETAAYIREHRVDVDIAFVTVATEHVFDGYTYQAFSYLLKPLDPKRVSEEMVRYMDLKQKGTDCLHVQISGRNVAIFLGRVRYFATEGRKIAVCQRGEGEEISFYAKMNDLEETLKDMDFIRIHQSYLVNARYVQSFSRTEIDVGGDSLPIARRYIEAVRKRFGSGRGGKE